MTLRGATGELRWVYMTAAVFGPWAKTEYFLNWGRGFHSNDARGTTARVDYAGLPVTHLKPHGALNNMAAEREDYALAIGRAIQTVDDSIVYVALYGSQMEHAGRKLGLRVAREGFADRHYEDDGNLSPRSIPGTVYKDPDKALAQCLSMVKDRCLTSRLGKKVTVEVETICLHGDEPTAVNVARHVRKGLEAAGCRIVTIPEMLN